MKALPVVALAAWAASVSAAPAASLEDVKREGALRVAVYRDYAPFADEGEGIDVDVARALAAKLGVKADVKGYPDADDIDGDLRNIIWRGHPLWREKLADVMMHVPVDPHVVAKNDKVLIFAPYFRERLVVARNKTRIPNLPTLQIFTEEKIGVEATTLEDRYLVSSFGGLLRDNVVHYKTLKDATDALLKGEVSAVMGRQTLIEAGLGKEAARFEITAAPAPGLATTGWELGLAVKADYPELRSALAQAMTELLKDGTVERIFAKRGLTYRAPVGTPKGPTRLEPAQSSEDAGRMQEAREKRERMRACRHRSEPRPRLRAAAAAVAWAAAALAAAAPARAGTLTRADLARWFPDPYVVGERDKDVPVWPIFRQSGPPSHTVELVGYAFESVDLAPVPGFSGTPVDLLVAIGTTGEFIDVAVLSQHEPVFLGGVGEEPLHRFITQYRGLSLKQNITIGSGTAKANRIGSTAVYLDGIAKATASLRIINQSVLGAALKVARTKLGFAGGRDPDLIAHVKPDLFEPRTWDELVRDGLVRHHVLRNRDVDAGFAGTEGARLDAETLARPDATFCDVWIAMATVPTAGRNLLGDAAWRTLSNRTFPGDHVLAVMTTGRCKLVSDAFQRNTVPDRLSLRQEGLPVELRDLDIDSPMRGGPGQPELDQAMTFRVIFQSGLDPGLPMQLFLRVTRAHGILYPDRYSHDFPLEFTVPARYLVPAAEDQKTWVATWKARRVEIAVLLAALTLLSVALWRKAPIVARIRPLRWFRPAFLLFTLGFVGWYAQGQLSIVNVVALLQAALAWRSWAFFLYDPMTAILWVFVIATAVVWGRGTFCGWLCPFGALQELAALLARALHLRRFRVPPVADRRLKLVKYAVLAVTLGAAAVSVRWSDRLVEVEPFKTAITMRFERTLGFVLYAAGTVVAGAFVYKAFCRYLCPFGAFVALAGHLRRFDWIARRVECGSPCQLCRNRCEYQAIEDDGRIHYAECFQCMDCVAVHDDEALCVPIVLARKGRPLAPRGERAPAPDAGGGGAP